MTTVSKTDLRSLLIFVMAVIVSVGIIYSTLPAYNDYRTGADEGIYYRQAKKVSEEGCRGFKILADEYINNPELQIFPLPIRIVHIFFAAIALKISDTYASLSVLSILFFIANTFVCFWFLRRHFGETVALAAGVLICFSPLGMGMSRRALSDITQCFFVVLALFAFIDFLQQQSRKNWGLFVCSFVFAVLVKESALFFLPFFAGSLAIHKFYLKREINITQAFTLLVSPLIIVFLLYLVFFEETIFEIFKTANHVNNAAPHLYVRQFNSGPWYEYFVDYFALSPLVSIAFFFYTGYYLLMNKDLSSPYTTLLIFFAWFIFIFSFLPMNVRYAQPLDFIYRTGAVLLLVEAVKQIAQSDAVKKVAVTSVVLLLLAVDVFAFRNFFVKYNIYDPVSFNLFQAENFFNLQSSETLPTTKLQSEIPQDAQYYVMQSAEYYNNRQYAECIDAAQKALAIKPDIAEAYNNICCAYNGLHEWDKAIEAGKKALAINPNYELARNNVNWAISQKESR